MQSVLDLVRICLVEGFIPLSTRFSSSKIMHGLLKDPCKSRRTQQWYQITIHYAYGLSVTRIVDSLCFTLDAVLFDKGEHQGSGDKGHLVPTTLTWINPAWKIQSTIWCRRIVRHTNPVQWWYEVLRTGLLLGYMRHFREYKLICYPHYSIAVVMLGVGFVFHLQILWTKYSPYWSTQDRKLRRTCKRIYILNVSNLEGK